jgi:hypothetical protein
MRLALAFVLLSGCGSSGPKHCDIARQDCSSAQKCTVGLVIMGGTATITAICRDSTGTVSQGATCTRNDPGNDSCARGLYCNEIGYDFSPDGTSSEMHCDKLCKSDGDCAASQRCAGLSNDSTVGVCVTTCAPGGACPSTLSCSRLVTDNDWSLTNDDVFFACRVSSGGGPIGTQCLADAFACLAPLTCDESGGCTIICNGTSDCGTSGRQCKPFHAGSTLGVCEL